MNSYTFASTTTKKSCTVKAENETEALKLAKKTLRSRNINLLSRTKIMDDANNKDSYTNYKYEKPERKIQDSNTPPNLATQHTQHIDGSYNGVYVKSMADGNSNIINAFFPDGGTLHVIGKNKIGALYGDVQNKINNILQGSIVKEKSLTINVAGVTFNNEDGEHRQTILQKLHIGSPLTLIYDVDNIYDKNSIKIMSQFGCIGHLPKKEALSFSRNNALLGECKLTSLKQVVDEKIGCLITFNYKEYEIVKKPMKSSSHNSHANTRTDYGPDYYEPESPSIDSPPEEPYDPYEEEIDAERRDGTPY